MLPSWTPEIFGTKVRGTACGIASALSRMYVSLSGYSTNLYASISEAG